MSGRFRCDGVSYPIQLLAAGDVGEVDSVCFDHGLWSLIGTNTAVFAEKSKQFVEI